ncbi:MAG TPA: STAS domain-containing protein [Rhodothermales bacterium]|nr:STAS domain-containing protein [Rhodothermales bacterium]HRR07686.1 STAS domain-containing protein [Rhodothermales bacterium]
MELKIEKQAKGTVIYLNGPAMGGPDGARLNEMLHTLLDEGEQRVVADLADVSFMNSSGLGMLISGMITMRNGGGDLRLCRVPDKIRNLINLTKLNSVFISFDTLEEALS